jgi:hypothetical protein
MLQAHRRWVTFLNVALLVTGHVVGTSAQTTSGRLVGQVFDENRRGLSGVLVRIVNENNGNARATQTDQEGSYIMPFLPPGLYKVVATKDGYTESSISDFAVPLNQTTDLRPPDITIRPVSSSQPSVPTPAAGPTVAAERASVLNTNDPARRGNFNERYVHSLPLGAQTDVRTFDEEALLAPGVAPPPYTPGVRGPGVGFGVGTAGEFSVNGMRARSNNFTVDGSDNNDPDVGVRRQGFVSLVPQSIESINEFEISTLLWDSELGRNFGSQVNVVSKGGGNAFHGQAYGFFTDSRLNARNFFDYSGGPSGGKDAYTRSQAGFVLGGPIVRDRTQLFVSFEHQDINATSEQHFATPTIGERDFRVFLGSILGSRPASFSVLHPDPTISPGVTFGVDPKLGTTPLGGNVLSFYPLPNNPSGPYGANTFTQVLPANGHGTVFSSKITHEINANHTLNARYNFTDDNRVIPAVNRAISSSIDAATRTQDISLILDSALSPTLFNQARFSYGRTRLGFSGMPGSPFQFQSASNALIGDTIFSSQTGPIGEILIDPFSPVGVDVSTFPQARVNNTFQYADSLSRKIGRHSIKFGGDIRRVQLNSLQDRNYRPVVEYGNGLLDIGNYVQTGPTSPQFFQRTAGPFVLPGVDLAAVGIPSSIFQTITSGFPNSTIGLRFTEYNLFFNDSWQVRPNFAVDYGLRYELNTVPHDANNRIENAITLKSLPVQGQSQFDTPERTAAFNAAVGAYQQFLGGRKNIYDPYHKEFGPHLGFAWDPWRDGKTSIRGGYGIYYDAILGAVVSQSRNVFPTEIPINADPNFLGFSVFNLNNPAFVQMGNVHLIAPGTLNQFGGARGDLVALLGSLFIQNQQGGGLAFTLPEKHLRPPYAQQWSISVERQIGDDLLLSVAYVGTRGTHLTRLTTPNLGPNLTLSIPVATGTGAPGTVFPLPAPTIIADSAALIRRGRPTAALGAYQVFEDSASSSYHALQVEARRKYRHGLTFTAGYTWSHAIDDVSDVFPIAGAPVLAQDQNNLRLERGNAGFDVRHRVAASLIWDIPFFSDSTGGRKLLLDGWQLSTFFQASSGQPFTLNLPIDANLDGNLTDRPSTSDGLVFLSGHSRERVAVSPGVPLTNFFSLGQDGFVGRNTARGDAFVDLDLGLSKRFRITERQAFDFRTEFFNVMNRANFGLPIRTIGAPGFGSAVDTANPGRIIQFALKYSF